MGNKHRLHKVYLRSIVVMAILAVTGTGALWILTEIQKFKYSVQKDRYEFTNDSNTLIKDEVTRALNSVNYAKDSSLDKQKKKMTLRVDNATRIADSIYNSGKGKVPDEVLQKLIINALREVKFESQNDHLFIVNDHGVSIFNADETKVEQSDFHIISSNDECCNINELMSSISDDKFLYLHFDKIYSIDKDDDGEAGGCLKNYLVCVTQNKNLNWYIGSCSKISSFIEKTQKEVILELENRHLKFISYLFATGYDGRVLMGPAKGKNIFDTDNEKAKKVVSRLIAKAKKGGGFITYDMPGVNGEEKVPKVSYVLPVKNWDWYIGAGVSLSKIEDLINAREMHLKKEIIRHLAIICALLLILLILAYWHASHLADRIKKSVDTFSTYMGNISGTKISKETTIDTNLFEFVEFKAFAESANKMLYDRTTSEERYRLLLNGSPVATGICDFNGNINFINKSFIKLFGYKLDQICTLDKWAKLAYPDPEYREKVKGKWLEQFFNGDFIDDIEVTVRTAYGDDKEILITASFHNGDLICHFQDNTDQNKMRNELEKAQKLLVASIENSPVGIVIAEAKDFSIKLANSVALNLSDKSGTSILTGDFDKVDDYDYRPVHPDGSLFLPEEIPLRKAVFKGEIVQNEKIIFKNEAGNCKTVIMNAAPVRNSAGEITAGVIVFLDISEQVKTEEILEHSRKMDAIGQLAGGVAHDFNNLLGGILGAADILAMDIDETHDSHEYLSMISKAAERASDLTSKLLTFSRKKTSSKVIFDVHDIIKDTVSILKNTIDKRISIQLLLNAEMSVIKADTTQIQNSLLNLGINASHAMENGGEITITTKNIQLGSLYCQGSTFDITPGEFLEIEIKDTGCGIPKSLLPRIFEPFFTTKEQGKGTGLGLAAVYGSVQQNNGMITVDSTVGTGTIFTLRFPAEEASSDSQDGDNGLTQGKGSVLLVDDEDIMRVTAGSLLKKLGFNVYFATNGNEAIKIYNENQDTIDLVILDMIMPVMNGLDCFKQLKNINSDVKVIISSGYSNIDDLEELKTLGVLDFIEKPYRINKLSEKIMMYI